MISARPPLRERPKTVPIPSMTASSPASLMRPASQWRACISTGERARRTTPAPVAPNWRKRRRSLSSRSGLLVITRSFSPSLLWRKSAGPSGWGGMNEPASRLADSIWSFSDCGFASAAVDVEIEVLLGDDVVGAIGTDRRDRLVQLLLQGGIALVNAAAHAIAKDDRVVPWRLRLDFEILALVGLHEIVQDDRIRHLEIEPAGDEIGVHVILRVIYLQGRRGKILGHEAGMGGVGLHPYDLALQAVGVLEIDVVARRLRPDDLGWRLVVFVGEVDGLLALVGDQHRR